MAEEAEEIVLTQKQTRRLIMAFAVLFFVLAVGVAVFSFVIFGTELRLLERTPQMQLFGLAVGQPVQLTATIKASNPPLIHDLVVACEESQSDDSTWSTRKEHHRPLAVDRAGKEILLTLRQPCPRGEHAVIPNPETSMRRWIGFRAGKRVTVVGKVTSVSPLSVYGEHYFGGSPDHYRRYLSRGRWYVLPFSAFCLLVGLLLLYAARKRR